MCHLLVHTCVTPMGIFKNNVSCAHMARQELPPGNTFWDTRVSWIKCQLYVTEIWQHCDTSWGSARAVLDDTHPFAHRLGLKLQTSTYTGCCPTLVDRCPSNGPTASASGWTTQGIYLGVKYSNELLKSESWTSLLKWAHETQKVLLLSFPRKVENWEKTEHEV